MKNRYAYFLFFILLSGSLLAARAPKREYYELRIYNASPAQMTRLHAYLKDAYLPALHRAGTKNVGVFKAIENDSLLYVLTPLKSLDQLVKLPAQLEKDAAYQAAGKDYIESAFKEPAYKRFETVIMQAFDGMPVHSKSGVTAPAEQRVYELRSYESPSEKRYLNKVKMFDSGEIDIFKKLDFNPVFFAKVIAGSKMPNLMYMTTFPDRATRDARWKAFGSDPDWGKLKVMPEYQDNMNKLQIIFLRPTDYSDL
jgi:hypothetical protein